MDIVGITNGALRGHPRVCTNIDSDASIATVRQQHTTINFLFTITTITSDKNALSLNS